MIRPLRDLIVIKPVEPIGKTPGGLLLPDNARTRPHEGVVIRVGPGRVNDNGLLVPMNVKEGETVYYTEFAEYQSSVKDEDGTEYLMLRESEVLAVKD